MRCPILDSNLGAPESVGFNRQDRAVGAAGELLSAVADDESLEALPGDGAHDKQSRIELVGEGSDDISSVSLLNMDRHVEIGHPDGGRCSLDVAVEHGIVRKAGAWFTYEGDQLGQGREKAKLFLRENPEISMQLQDRVLRAVGVIADEETEEAEEGAEETEAVDSD